MTALYELAHDYRNAADKLADLDLDPQTIEDTLESLSGDLEVKATNTAMLIRNLEASAAAIGDAEAQMAARRKALENRAKRIKDYVLNWYAWPLQHRGAKMTTAIVMHGAEGTGKNLVNEAVAAIHGKHGKVVGQRELESQWNDWLSGCTFVIGDEVVSRQEMRHHKGVLKALITSAHVNIATKFMNLRTERNCMNMVFLSNEVEPLKLDPSDRRYMVIWTQARGAPELYARFVAWRDAGGVAALYDELLKRDLTGWEWHAPPPRTGAKEALIELGRLSPERFWREWRAHEIAGLPHRSCSSDQAYRAYKRWCSSEGERWPMSKPHFTRLVQREAGEALAVRVCKVGAGGSTLRMWTVAPPPEEVTFADWAEDAVQAFEDVLRRWIGSSAEAAT